MQQTKSIVAKFYDALNSKGDEKKVREVLSDDWVVHPAMSGAGTDVEKYLAAVKPIFVALPDFNIEVAQMLAEGDYVAVRGAVKATHANSLLGVPATHQPIHYMTQDFHRVVNGKIAESWHVEDWLSVLFQIGAMKF